MLHITILCKIYNCTEQELRQNHAVLINELFSEQYQLL